MDRGPIHGSSGEGLVLTCEHDGQNAIAQRYAFRVRRAIGHQGGVEHVDLPKDLANIRNVDRTEIMFAIGIIVLVESVERSNLLKDFDLNVFTPLIDTGSNDHLADFDRCPGGQE